jgi:hypothetical protein
MPINVGALPDARFREEVKLSVASAARRLRSNAFTGKVPTGMCCRQLRCVQFGLIGTSLGGMAPAAAQLHLRLGVGQSTTFTAFFMVPLEPKPVP